MYCHHMLSGKRSEICRQCSVRVTHGHYSILNSTGVNIIWFIRQCMLCKQLFSLEKHVGHCTGGRNELRNDSMS